MDQLCRMRQVKKRRVYLFISGFLFLFYYPFLGGGMGMGMVRLVRS